MSDLSVPTFDLTSEPWLPVQRVDGAEQELSLVEVFAQAELLRGITGDVATQEFALYRLLLAIVHDAIDGPADTDEWQKLWRNGLPVDRITAYLAEHRDRFDLLHPATPFFQTPELHTSRNEIGSLNKIVADVPDGAGFFTMRATGVDRLSFAEAARWLVHAHAYDTAGIKTGVVGDRRVKAGKCYAGQGCTVAWAGNLGGVLVEGNNLRETLLLNLIAFEDAEDAANFRIHPERDAPAWRRPPSRPGPVDELELTTRPAGPRDLYTWQSRRIRLHFDSAGVYGAVLTYGDPLDSPNRFRNEPMSAWRRSRPQEKKLGRPVIYMPRTHEPGRSAWRGLGALVTGQAAGWRARDEDPRLARPGIVHWIASLCTAGALPPDFLIRTRLYGAVYGTQQSVIDEIVADEVAMPIVLLREQDAELGRAAVSAVADAEQAVWALGNLAANLARARGGEPDPAAERARERGFAALDGPFRTWLAGLHPGDAEDQRARWHQQAAGILRALGDELITEAGDAAWDGRVTPAKDGKQIWLNTASARGIFYSGLRKALPGAVPTAQNAPAAAAELEQEVPS